LLNLGGPETQEDVEGFLYNLFADPDIIRLPDILSGLQKPLAYFIAKKRAPKSAAAYLTIGGGSPIVKYTREQASLIQSALSERGFDSKCYFAMRYWHPYTEEVLDEMHKDGVNALVVVPLYPQYSISTSGSSLKLLQDIFLQQPER
jgi:ferrochelatase